MNEFEYTVYWINKWSSRKPMNWPHFSSRCLCHFQAPSWSRSDILPYLTYPRLEQKPQIYTSCSILKRIERGISKPIGWIITVCQVFKRPSSTKTNLDFFVTPQDHDIIGKKACEEVRLVKRVHRIDSEFRSKNDLVQRYDHLFRAIGL